MKALLSAAALLILLAYGAGLHRLQRPGKAAFLRQSWLALALACIATLATFPRLASYSPSPWTSVLPSLAIYLVAAALLLGIGRLLLARPFLAGRLWLFLLCFFPCSLIVLIAYAGLLVGLSPWS
jgi:hypothetical protein